MADEKNTGISSGVDIEKDKHVDPTLKKHAQDADEAMKAFDEMQGEAIELDEGTNKRLLRIIDWHMMPIMCFVYGMNYLDSMFCLCVGEEFRGCLGCILTVLETTLSYASIMGLKTDLKLDPDGDEYQWLGSLFYFGELSCASFTSYCGRSQGLMQNRVSGLGIPHKPSAAVVAARQIFCLLYPGLGVDSVLLCRDKQLWWCRCDSVLPRCL